MKRRNLYYRVFLAASLVGFTSSAVCQSEEWQWNVTPYAWAISTQFDTRLAIGDGGGISSEQSFRDILDTLDFAALVHAEGQRGRLGAFADFSYLKVSDGKDFDALRTRTTAESAIVEVAGFYGSGDKGEDGMDVFAGIRALILDVELQALSQEDGSLVQAANADETFADFMFGARFRQALGAKWRLSLRGDVSTGDTDFTWQAAAFALRDIGSTGQLVLGYRHLDFDFGDVESLLKTSYTISGPLVGYSFNF